MRHSRPLHLYFRLFNTVDSTKQKLADGWTRTADLWRWKRPLYQLSYNHCPTSAYLYIRFEIASSAKKLFNICKSFFKFGPSANTLNANYFLILGNSLSTVGRAVACDSRGPGFESVIFTEYLCYVIWYIQDSEKETYPYKILVEMGTPRVH